MSEQAARGPDDQDELIRLHAEFDQLWAGVQGLQLWWGPLRVRARLGSQRLAALFTAFHGLTAAAGVMFIFMGESFAELGVALVVGSLFGIGAFVAQVWALQSERETALVFDEHRARFVELQRRWDELMARREGGDQGSV